MKNLLFVFVLCAGLGTCAVPAFAGGETKEVCEVQKDKSGKVVKNKDGSDKQTCKKIKVHKKVEGEKVPEKK